MADSPFDKIGQIVHSRIAKAEIVGNGLRNLALGREIESWCKTTIKNKNAVSDTCKC